MKTTNFLKTFHFALLLIGLPVYAENCPDLPSNFEELSYADSTTQKERAVVAKHYLCNLNLNIIPSKVLTERGFKLKIIDPENRIKNIKEALSSNNYSKLFYGGNIPEYSKIKSRIEKYIRHKVDIVLKSNSSVLTRDFKAGGSANTVISKFSESEIHMQELSNVYLVNPCGNDINDRWKEFQLRSDKQGWFSKRIDINNCPNKILAVNPRMVIYEKGRNKVGTSFAKAISPYENVWSDFDGSDKLEIYIKRKLITDEGSFTDKESTLNELVSFGEISKTERAQQLHMYSKQIETAYLEMINQSEQGFIHVLDYLDEKGVKYKMR